MEPKRRHFNQSQRQQVSFWHSATGTVATVSGTGPWTAVITGMTSTASLNVGDVVTATAGLGSLGSTAQGTIVSVDSLTGITVTVTAGQTWVVI